VQVVQLQRHRALLQDAALREWAIYPKAPRGRKAKGGRLKDGLKPGDG
jgi:hypothetical protein